ncbi:hypothetical protein Pfo_005817, partial [Paulownia fortunei]
LFGPKLQTKAFLTWAHLLTLLVAQTQRTESVWRKCAASSGDVAIAAATDKPDVFISSELRCGWRTSITVEDFAVRGKPFELKCPSSVRVCNFGGLMNCTSSYISSRACQSSVCLAFHFAPKQEYWTWKLLVRAPKIKGGKTKYKLLTHRTAASLVG